MWFVQEPVEDLDPEQILDLQTDSRLHVISGGTKVVQHSPPLKASAGLKRKNYFSLLFVAINKCLTFNQISVFLHLSQIFIIKTRYKIINPFFYLQL